MVSALAPPLAEDPPPAFLREHQVAGYRRAVAAIRRFHGAMVAEPVGTGKTWIALAVAARFGSGAACVVPSVLVPQWKTAAARAGVRVDLSTHEAWSRKPRRLGDGLVIIDESHRFRTPGIRRTLHLAAALVGREGLLLTATPVINSLADLVSQLLLLVRDDALAPHGIGSLTTVLTEPGYSMRPALGSVIISGTMGVDRRPALRNRQTVSPELSAEAARLLEQLDLLRLSDQPTSRALLLGVMSWAAGSSPAALAGVLDRYRLLLLQARDAAAAGQAPSRRTLHQLLAGDLQQTVLWSMLAPGDEGGDPPLEDLPGLDRLLEACRHLAENRDPKVEQLRSILADGITTLVFVTSRATVEYLRRRLANDHLIGWCHGAAAGIGPGRLAREQVLAWFKPDSPSRSGHKPTVLITTDVGAEGLDLQGASRVIHYDLPWTPSRLEQRVGRVHREGGLHPSVEVVRFALPAPVERRIALARALRRKDQLVDQVRVGAPAHRAWTWQSRLATTLADCLPCPGVSAVRGSEFRCLLGYRMDAADRPIAARMVALDHDGRWCEDGTTIERALLLAAAARPTACPSGSQVRQLLVAADEPLRMALRNTAGSLWGLNARSQHGAAASRRFRLLATSAARRRDRAMLTMTDRVLQFLNRGHTLGELQLIDGLEQAAETGQLEELIRQLPVEQPWIPPVRVEVTGLIVFVPTDRPEGSVGGPRAAE